MVSILMVVFVLLLTLWIAITRIRIAVSPLNRSLVNVLAIGSIIQLGSVIAWPLHDNEYTCVLKPIMFAVGWGIYWTGFNLKGYKLWVHLIVLPGLELREIRSYLASPRRKYEIRQIVCTVIVLELAMTAVMIAIPSQRPHPIETCLDSADEERFTVIAVSCSEQFESLGLVGLVNLLGMICGIYFPWKVRREFTRAGGEIMRVKQENVDQFERFLFSYFCVFAFGGLLLAYMHSGLPTQSEDALKLYYVIRSFTFLILVLTPVYFVNPASYKMSGDEIIIKGNARETITHQVHKKMSIQLLGVNSKSGKIFPSSAAIMDNSMPLLNQEFHEKYQSLLNSAKSRKSGA